MSERERGSILLKFQFVCSVILYLFLCLLACFNSFICLFVSVSLFLCLLFVCLVIRKCGADQSETLPMGLFFF